MRGREILARWRGEEKNLRTRAEEHDLPAAGRPGCGGLRKEGTFKKQGREGGGVERCGPGRERGGGIGRE
jgi:hypothetical protein